MVAKVGTDDLARLAQKYFQLQLPTTAGELKSAFRRESRKHHPDFGGNPENFKKMVDAYNILLDPKHDFVFEAVKEAEKTEEGILLSQLGIGLDRSKNSILCDTCSGKGYKSIQSSNDFISCTTCRGSGFAKKCTTCRGVGHTVFDLKIRKVKVRCPSCGGNGWVGIFASYGNVGLQSCPSCHGRGGFKRTKPTYKHFKCGDCDGKGEREMFNPPLPKGRIQK